MNHEACGRLHAITAENDKQDSPADHSGGAAPGAGAETAASRPDAGPGVMRPSWAGGRGSKPDTIYSGGFPPRVSARGFDRTSMTPHVHLALRRAFSKRLLVVH